MIITFYSYKGGVGRTQLVANLAGYLCYEKSQKVLLIDWDMEAPGLHYYFNKTDDYFKDGLIELFNNYLSVVKSGSANSKENLPRFDENYIYELISTEKKGRVDIIPAGNYNSDYNANVNGFNWPKFYEFYDGKRYIEFIKQELKKLDYDYIFIDSRTGISDYSGICNIQMPDANVLVVAPTLQNIVGCKKMADEIINSEYVQGKRFRKDLVIPILSRLDKSVQSIIDQWTETFSETFSEPILKLKGNPHNDSSEDIITDYIKSTLLNYERGLSAGENLLFAEKAKRITLDLSDQYKNVASLIESLKISIYISSSQKDSEIVKRVVANLTNKNRNFKFHFTDSNSDFNIESSQYDQIKHCSLMFLFISKDSLYNLNILNEYVEMYNHKKNILPIYLDNTLFDENILSSAMDKFDTQLDEYMKTVFIDTIKITNKEQKNKIKKIYFDKNAVYHVLLTFKEHEHISLSDNSTFNESMTTISNYINEFYLNH